MTIRRGCRTCATASSYGHAYGFSKKIENMLDMNSGSGIIMNERCSSIEEDFCITIRWCASIMSCCSGKLAVEQKSVDVISNRAEKCNKIESGEGYQ